MKGTAWAAYNAITYYIDHIGVIDKTGFANKQKKESALMGSSSKKKEKGWNLLVSFMESEQEFYAEAAV